MLKSVLKCSDKVKQESFFTEVLRAFVFKHPLKITSNEFLSVLVLHIFERLEIGGKKSQKPQTLSLTLYMIIHFFWPWWLIIHNLKNIEIKQINNKKSKLFH